MAHKSQLSVPVVGEERVFWGFLTEIQIPV